MDIKEKIGKRIKSIREIQGISQKISHILLIWTAAI